jgi:colicin import membrane protein
MITMSATAAPEAPVVSAEISPVIELPPEIKLVVKQTGIESITAQHLMDEYRPFFGEVHRLLAEAKTVNVTDATQVTMIRKARELRLSLREQRVAADKKREQLKAESLRQGKAVDGMCNVLKFLVEPIEERLLAAEQFAERAEAARKEQLKAERAELLKPYGVDPAFYPLGDMPDDQFQKMLDGARLAQEAQIAAKKKADDERIAKEKADADERERVRLENERLKKEAEESAAREAAAKVEREKAELARKEAEDKARKERQDAAFQLAEQTRKAEEAAAAERARVQKEREAAEAKAAKERAELEAKAKVEKEKADAENARKLAAEKKKAAEATELAAKERAAREKAEAESRAAREAEEKRIADELEAKRKAATAPDREKLMKFAEAVRALQIPELSMLDAIPLVTEITGMRERFALYVEKKAAAL